MTSSVHGGTFFYNKGLLWNIKVEELVDHRYNFLIAGDLHIRIPKQQLGKRSRVIRFHVLDYQKIQVAAIQRMLKILEELVTDCFVNRVEQNRRFVK